jgi:hypothetical protein
LGTEGVQVKAHGLVHDPTPVPDTDATTSPKPNQAEQTRKQKTDQQAEAERQMTDREVRRLGGLMVA